MIYFANPSTEGVREAITAGHLGCIVTPRQGNRVVPGSTWCADNGVYGKGYPGEDRWWAWLGGVVARNDLARCSFAVAPDVVGDHDATLARSLPWLARLRDLGAPVAFVAQNGISIDTCPWESLDVLFIGGDDEFKLGRAAVELTLAAREQGKGVHMGRVNSLTRLRYAQFLGVDSCDGTFIKFAPTENLGRMMRFLDRVADNPPLFGAAL